MNIAELMMNPEAITDLVVAGIREAIRLELAPVLERLQAIDERLTQYDTLLASVKSKGGLVGKMLGG